MNRRRTRVLALLAFATHAVATLAWTVALARFAGSRATAADVFRLFVVLLFAVSTAQYADVYRRVRSDP